MKEMIKKERKSNIELLRIISMCLIIYHHFSLNLGIIEGYDISKTMIFGILGGIGGKIGVVCYVLTTGYFSVEKDFNVKRVFKLWLQIFCYSVGFMLFFRITGIEKLNNVDTIKTFFPFAYNQYWFMTAYLYLMVLTPFINKLLNVLKQQDYKKMIVVLTIFLVIIPTIFYTSGMIGSTLTPIGVILFVYLYIIGGYIKLYGLKFFENKKAKNMFLIVLGYVIITCLVLIGKKLGLSDEDINRLKIGGLFHDVGKIGVPDNILQKNGKLSDDEYSEIKNHPTIGAHILSTASIFKDILPIVKYHHERYDGRGYPEMLKGEEIPYLARITAIADTFDAMTSKRVYRDSLPLDRVIEEFKRCRGTQFDPELDDLFVDILENNYEEIEEIKNKYQAEI